MVFFLLVIVTIIMAMLGLLVAIVTISVLTQHCNVSDGLEANPKAYGATAMLDQYSMDAGPITC